MKKWIWRVVLALAAIAIVAGIAVSMQPKPIAVDVHAVAATEMRVSVAGEGRTRVKDHYVVTAPVHGNLGRIDLSAGDPVEDGTVVARIEATAPPLLDASQRDELKARSRASAAAERQASASVSRAKNAQAYSQREFDRAKQLFEKGGLSRSELDAAQASLDAAKTEMDSARFASKVAKHQREMAAAAAARAEEGQEREGDQQLEIHSPIAGRVMRILRQSEGIVQPGEALCEIADPAKLEVVIDVLTAESVEVTPGDEVAITQWGGERPLRGRVRLIEPAAFTKVSALGVEEQRVNVVIDLEDPPENRERLGDGFRVEVAITVWREPEATTVPVSALFREGDDWAVFVLDGGVANTRVIQVGQRNDFEVHVLEGLALGEQVVLHPSDSLHDGGLAAARD